MFRELPYSFRKKVTEEEEVSQLGCVDTGNKSQSQKKGAWRQVQGVSLG